MVHALLLMVVTVTLDTWANTVILINALVFFLIRQVPVAAMVHATHQILANVKHSGLEQTVLFQLVLPFQQMMLEFAII
jgi:hypothetical protein